MYISRAVESMRADPIEGDSVALVLETAETAAPESIAEAAEAAGATVDRHLQFDDLLITVPQERIDDVCALDGLDAVQTADAISITTADDAEEDVEFGN